VPPRIIAPNAAPTSCGLLMSMRKTVGRGSDSRVTAATRGVGCKNQDQLLPVSRGRSLLLDGMTALRPSLEGPLRKCDSGRRKSSFQNQDHLPYSKCGVLRWLDVSPLPRACSGHTKRCATNARLLATILTETVSRKHPDREGSSSVSVGRGSPTPARQHDRHHTRSARTKP
jgi:hypothetical protein